MRNMGQWQHPMRLLVVALALTSMSGCGGPKEGVAIEPPQTTIQFRVTSDTGLNDCGHSGSRPVVLRIYPLARVERFQSLAGIDFWYGEPDQFGSDLLVPSPLEMTILPGSTAPQLVELPIAQGMMYVGIAANFCEAKESCWKATISVQTDLSPVSVNLKGVCVDVRRGIK